MEFGELNFPTRKSLHRKICPYFRQLFVGIEGTKCLDVLEID
jgi:hypothetical protein